MISSNDLDSPLKEGTSYLQTVVSEQPDYHSEKSEEVQSIIDRMPTHWVKWVALCVGSLIGIIIFFLSIYFYLLCTIY